MCGIAGYRSEMAIAEPVLGAMTEALFHRGPDSAGYLRSGPFNAGMRRLKIVDLKTGDQPLFNQSRDVALFYNGEIYNAPELRRDLETKGYRFRTRCDGEVICHLYDEYGEDLFERLDGMFAAALWVESARRLILARDIPGEKPLFYAELPDGALAFASEIKSLVRFPGIDLDLNLQALWDFPTFLWVPEPDTIYHGIRALPPGHILTHDQAGFRLRPYGNRFATAPRSFDDQAAVAETRRIVTEAIKSRLLSDVPVGAFLSSGLDSSIVAAIAAGDLDTLTTFSVGFEDLPDPQHGRSDESADAQAFAKRIGSKHHIIRVTADGFRRDLDAFCTYGDQPFAVSSGLGILSVARAAREAGIKVLLSGDGADECFGGYSWYPYLPRADFEANGSAMNGAPAISFLDFGLPLEQRLDILAHYPPQQRAWAWHYFAAEPEKERLFDRAAFDGVQPSWRFFQDFNPAAHWPAEDFIRQDRGFYLPNEMLRKVDRMTMAHSVEGRAPFVAPAVLAHADKLKFSQMVRDGDLKWVLRRAFADVLPKDVLNRPKHGFNVPVDHWLRHEWRDLLDETFAPGSALDRLDLIAADAGAAARRMADDPDRLNGHTLLSYIMLNRWLDHERY